MKKTLLIVGGLFIVSGVGIWAYGRFVKPSISVTKEQPSDKTTNENFDKLIKLTNGKKDSNGVVSISFNGGKNTANFYSNNRIIIFAGVSQIGKGTYSDGGLTISIEGKAPIKGSSVFSNLLKTI